MKREKKLFFSHKEMVRLNHINTHNISNVLSKTILPIENNVTKCQTKSDMIHSIVSQGVSFIHSLRAVSFRTVLL